MSRFVFKMGSRTFQCEPTSLTECIVAFDDIVLTFRRVGLGLMLTAKARVGGRQLKFIPDSIYQDAKTSAKNAFEAHKEAQRAVHPQQIQLFS